MAAMGAALDGVIIMATVSYQGKNYKLIGDISATNRVFSGWWGDAKNGEEYIAEYSAPAVGDDGEEYVIRWQFDVIKGDEPEDDTLDWENVYQVIAA